VSEEHVREIILKAFDDSEFRELLTADLEKATQGYELSEGEIENLKGLGVEYFDDSLSMEERISRSASWN